MKNLKQKIAYILATTSGFMVSLSLPIGAMAAGGGSPYGPYGPHVPVDTGLVGVEELAITLGVILYASGLAVLAYVKFFKGKISQAAV